MTGWQQSLSDLSRRHEIEPPGERRLERLVAALSSESHAPTAVREPSEAVDQHLADSLVSLELPRVREARRFADLGSGAGFPGLVLAVVRPTATVDLIESRARHVEFLERMMATTGISNARAVAERVEMWGLAQGREAYELVTARALASLPVLVEYAAPLLRIDGALVAWRGARDREEERVGDRAAEQVGLSRGGVVAVEPFPGAHSRHLHVFVKRDPTPDRFPRRPGIAVKRPLG